MFRSLLLAFVAVLPLTVAHPIDSEKVHDSAIEARALPPYNPSAPKRGLPFNNPSIYIQHFKGVGSQITWAYNWDSYMDPGFPPNMDFVPMLWGDGADRTANWFRNVDNAISRGAHHILAFNEPDLCGWGSSCMTPQRAVDAYRRYIQPYKGRAYLGAPAISNGANGIQWLKDFLRLCVGCHIDFIPVHWYDAAWNDGYFRLHLQNVRAATQYLGLNIWVTEFNAAGSPGQQIEFMKKVLPWLDQTNWISHYSWFWADPKSDRNPLVGWNGWPTDVGNFYAYAKEMKWRLDLALTSRAWKKYLLVYIVVVWSWF